jgi:hypothetical protein
VSADLTRLTSIDRSTAPTTAPNAPVGPSRALTRVAPAVEQEPAGSPLGRSGLDLVDLFAVNDQVALRESTGSVAREVGLEQTRGLLLRNLPGEALASLDTVWEGARHSEEGWYLRSGALAALGLPGESDRVADEALALRPTSMALRFVQSFARLALGDAVGARTTLEPALDRAPAEPLLIVQRALVQAKQGDVRGAHALLQELAGTAPEHPAIVWGRAMLRAAAADEARQLVQSTPVAAPTLLTERVASVAEDAATRALERFGEQVATLSTMDTIGEARMLMRAFSTGGALAGGVTPEHAHAVRLILMTFLAVADGARTISSAPLRSLMAIIVPLLQQGRADDAERLVRRQRPLFREPVGRLLLDIVRGAQPPENAMANARLRETPAAGALLVRGEPESGPLIPVRLGLGLLEETPASRVALDSAGMAWTATGLPYAVREDGSVVRYMMSGVMQAIPDSNSGPEMGGQGWGAARSAAATVEAGPSERTLMPLGVVVLIALTLGALLAGHWVVAMALGIGAAWFVLQRRGSSIDRPQGPPDEMDATEAHERSSLR